MSKNFASILRVCLFVVLMAGLVFQPQTTVHAAANLTITPITWNVIGLDSNNVNVGPNHFPVGARVCNAGDTAATNLSANFVWDSANIYINNRPGTLTSLSVSSLAAGSCTDFYFEVEVTRNPAAYDTTRDYHIAVTADGGLSVSTPTPRTLYVEHLVSQNRNAVTDVQYGTSLASLSSVASGGTMTLLVGNTYYIRLVGFTATQGYEQLESFINIPNTIFQVNSVSTTYTADTSATVSSPNDKAYGDACAWENDPNSPNYRSCLTTGKVGGNITVTYQVTILQAPSAPLVNPQPLSTLIYDFSGSSFHYNADFGVSTRYAFILDPSTLTIAKNFNPDPTNAGGISTLTFTLTNPNAASVSGLNFMDTFPTTPGAMTVASPTNASTSGCGTPTFAPVAGAGFISFSNGTIAANSACTITVNVTVPVTGTYTNTSNNLFVGTLDTGNSATDPLTVNSTPPAPTPVCGLSIAQWTFPTGFNTASPAPSSGSGTATPGAGILSTAFTEGTDSWGSNGSIDTTGTLTTTNNDYVQFAITTTGYSSIELTFNAARKNIPNSPRGIAVYYSSGTGNNPEPNTPLYNNATALPLSTTAFSSFGAFTFTPTATTMYVRIYFYNAGNSASGSDIFVDNVTFTGCAIPNPPTLTKAFSPNPIAVNGTSTLTFTLSNSNSIALTGATFTDTLPNGLQVAGTPAAITTCGGTPTWAPTAGSTNLTFGSPTGATIPANGSCTVSVNVTATAVGDYQNVSGFISSTNGGTNTGSTGSASAALTVLKPPVISKLFSPNPILANGVSALTFTVTNPNLDDPLSGVAFSDTFPVAPGAMVVANPIGASTSGCGTPTYAPVAGAGSISFSNGTLAAGGTCTVTVNVTAPVTGSYANTSSAVTALINGSPVGTDTASDTLTVNAPSPAIALLKQVSTSSTGLWSSFLGVAVGANVYYQFTVENAGDVALTSVNVADPAPYLNLASCVWRDGDGDALSAPFTLPVAQAADNDHIAVCVLGPVTAASGSHPNTATATGTYSAVNYTDNSTATYATTALTLVKSVTETSFTAAGDTLNYSYLVTNSGFAPLLGPVTVTDDKATVTCPAVTSVGDNDTYLDPGESLTCTATYTVQAADVTAGFVTNTASASADDVDSNTDSETVYILRPDLTVTKTNNVSGSVAQNGSFNWTLTVTNSGIATASFVDTQLILTDTLPGGASYDPQLTVTNGATPPTGTISCSITGTALSCAANGGIVTLPVGASFSVTFAVTPSVAGSLANTATVDPNGVVTEITETNNTGSDTVTVVAPPVIAKSFSPNPTVANVASTLTFTITNPNSGVDFTGVAFSDTYPFGLVNATPLSTTNTCGGTLTAVAGGNGLSLNGGSITVNDVSCTITISVVAASGGSFQNITGAVSSTNGGTGNTASATLNVFEAQPTKSLVNTSEAFTGIVSGTARVAIGEMVRYRLAALIPEGTFANVQLLDGIPNGLQFLNDGTAMVAFVCNGGAGCMTSSTLSGAGLVVNGASNAVSPVFVLPGSAISAGPFGSGTDVTFSLGNITNSDSDTDSEYIVVEFNALVLNVNSSAQINQGVDNDPASPTAGDSNSNNRQNNVTLFVNGSQVGTTSPNVGVWIAESAITSITKSVTPATDPYLPGDTLTYTLSFSNNATGNRATTAFDIVLTDTLDANLTAGTVNVSSTQGTTCAGGNVFTTGNSTVGQVVTVTVSCLDPGQTVSVTIAATISAGTTSGTTIANSAGLTYTSLPGTQGNCATAPFTCTGVGGSGSGAGERNGSGGPGADSTVLNNYAATSNTVNATVSFGSITVTKDALPDSAQDFAFTGTGANSFNFGGGFSLDDDADGTLPNTTTFTNLVAGAYSLTETGVTGWSLTGLTCTDPDSGSTTDLGTATASIDLDASETVSCTFTNTELVAAMVLTKTPTLDDTIVAPSGVVNAGDTITYTFSVENTGNVTLSNIVVTDPLLPTLSCTIASLAPAATASCTAANNVYTLTQADINAGSRANTATADGDDPSNNPVTDTDTQTTTLTQSASIELLKTGTLNDDDGTPGISAGDTISYAFTVTNTGNITLTDVVVNDTIGGVTVNGGPLASLAPGASDTTTFTGMYALTITDIANGSFTNTATAMGEPPSGPAVTDTDDDTQNLVVSPAIVLTKTPTLNDAVVAPAGVVNVGDTITYTFSVENTGNVTVTNIVVTDPLLPTLSCTIASLAPAATASCTATNNVYTLTQADINAGSRANTASATGTDPGNNPVTDTDSQTTTLTQSASIELLKTGTLNDDDGTAGISPGDTISYAFTVTNTGNVTLTNVVVNDTIGGVTVNGGPLASLAPGASDTTTFTGTYTISANDIAGGSFTNTATAMGEPPSGPAVTDTDDDTQDLTFSPAIVLTKTPTLDDTVVAPSGVVNVGDTITYTFSVENTGNVTVTNIVVTDPLLPTLSCTIATLAPAATASCTATNNVYTLTQSDIDAGSRANTATAEGDDPANNPVTDTDTQTTSLGQVSTIVLTKTPTLDDTVVAPGGVINVGDTITYTFSVENTGNVTVTNIVVTDPLLPTLSCTIASLPPGASASCTPTNNVYTLTQADIDAGSRANTATAEGEDPGNNPVTDPDTQTTPLTQTPALVLVKEVSTDNTTWNDTSVTVTVGATVYYRIRVQNTGNITLTGLTVDDGMAGCTLTRGTDLTGDNDADFEVGEEWVYTCSVTAVLGTVDNTATAATNETQQVSDDASYTGTNVLIADPALSKAGSPTQAAVGEVVTFTITVTNNGNAPASNVVITDPLPTMFNVTGVTVTGAPFGTSVNVTPAIGTGPAPYTVVVTLGGDLLPGDLVTIQIATVVNGLGATPIDNTARLTTSSLSDVVANNADAVTFTLRVTGATVLPATGFAPQRETLIPLQPRDQAYAATEVVLEIPSLGVRMPIVGIPKKNGTWDVTWLTNQAGWLEGTAFPSWKGNSVLTSHVYGSNGLPGPFVNLNRLKYGDRLIIHAYGQKYVFEVRTNQIVEANDTTALQHEERSWLTLITCKEYDARTNTYKKRVVVRAVLISIE